MEAQSEVQTSSNLYILFYVLGRNLITRIQKWTVVILLDLMSLIPVASPEQY